MISSIRVFSFYTFTRTNSNSSIRWFAHLFFASPFPSILFLLSFFFIFHSFLPSSYSSSHIIELEFFPSAPFLSFFFSFPLFLFHFSFTSLLPVLLVFNSFSRFSIFWSYVSLLSLLVNKFSFLTISQHLRSNYLPLTSSQEFMNHDSTMHTIYTMIRDICLHAACAFR